MTLGEGKRKALMLMDEYSSSGVLTVDEDLELRMADFFDLAQKISLHTRKSYGPLSRKSRRRTIPRRLA